MFSETPIAKVPPFEPTPAPAVTSPVGFSSTSIFIIFKFFCVPSLISDSTELKIFLDLIFATDFFKFNSVNGSPSSNNNSPRITASLVTLFPKILILSTSIFSDWKC